jgi:triosephosphate isomerase
MTQPDIDGALVGGASLDAGEFVRICRYRELTPSALQATRKEDER